MTDKRTLRAAARAARDAFAARPHLPILVAPAFEALLRAGAVVASYVPIGSEADPAPLEHAARAHGCRLALPHVVDRATPLRFLAWDPDVPLAAGPFGLRQPADHPHALAPDVVLTPLVAFDRRGNRIGQGAGHYDRAFAAFPRAHRIGIAWSVQEQDAIAADPWDMPLHAIATEREWIAA
jgi:5-formyltetrahydrofolate cyclo-ligase